ncbi:contactin-3-like isoform X2 [Dysidea avara]|uniref:contactin-3-like isoform X2 n=1 Tax=Dysidea avara TaxID=196820 RepID=UPI00331810E8
MENFLRILLFHQAFNVVVNAECSDLVEFVVNNKTFNNATTLYKPNNTGGVVHCLRCDRDFEFEVLWFTSDGPSEPRISSCDDDDMPVPCTKTVGAPHDIDRDLVFSTFVTGTYKCGGTQNQETIIIIAIGPPEITDHPTGGDVPMGRSITLMCRASGLGTLVYSWERRASRRWTTISSDNTTEFSVTQNGRYRCNVSNEAGSVVSNSTTVNVYGPPTIITHPTSQLTTVSMSVTLNCEGTGRGSITYQWQTRNINGGQWSDISNSSNRRVVVRNLQESQQYRCVVSNEAGGTRSDVATVTVLKITTHPSSTNVIALQDAMLTCSASVDDVTYSWHRDGGSVPSRSTGQNRNTLTITRATPSDEGMYYCMSNKEGISVESNRARVIVDDQLSISVTPTNPVIGERGTAQFTATASGVNMRNFMYQWRKRGSSSLPNKVSGVNGTVLTIPNLVVSDEGVYYCTVTDEWGRSMESNSITLTVSAGLPLFWRYPQNQFVNNNDKVTFDCFVNGSDSLTITWEKDRRSYTSGVTQVTHSNGVSSSLTLNRARVADSGKYRCRATNADGNSVTSNEAELLILPQILTNPDDDTVFIGQSTQLTCNALGTDIVYQWMKDGVVVSGTNSNMLRITNIEESDEGVYKCMASNKGGLVESNPATITVYGPPLIQELPQQVHVVLGEEFQITCTATNDQDAPRNLMFSWRIPEEVEFNETTTDEDDSRTAYSTLHISSVTNNDNGSYTCNVRNIKRGSGVGTSLTLIVEEKSSQPTNFTIIEVHTNSLKLTWTVPTNPHGSINYYNVYYNNSDQPVQMVYVTNFTGNYTLDNLRPYTEYSVYVTAVRLIGTTSRPLEGEKSRTVTARTLAGEPIISTSGQSKRPRLIVNIDSFDISDTFVIDLPVISIENGPFSYFYIIVITDDIVVDNVQEIATVDLLKESTKATPLFYVAAVVDVSQYVPGYRMSYILGAGDNTTDPDGHVFYNREVKRTDLYFFRVYSSDSTQENEIFTTTDLQLISQRQKSDENICSSDSSDSNVVVIAVLAVVMVVSIVCNIALTVWVFMLQKQKLSVKVNHNDTKQASAAPEPAYTYELVDKSSDVKLENNPAYSVSASQGSSGDHHYDVIPASHHAKAK